MYDFDPVDEGWMASPLATAIRFSQNQGETFYVERHQKLISDAIVNAFNGDGPQFIAISMPPQHGKSTLITRRTPEWFLGNCPHLKVGIAGYGASFASDWGRMIRNDVVANRNLLQFDLAEDSKAADVWHTAEGGELWTAGIQSGATGRGSHLLIMDDPVKNFMQANSTVYRQQLWDEFLRTFFSRVQKNGVCLVVMTRWHTDDLVGRLLSGKRADDGRYMYGDPSSWLELRMPAIWEEDKPDVLGRKKGEALCPNRYDVKSLTTIRNQNNDETWLSLYQQIPLNQTGIGRAYVDYSAERNERELVRDWNLPFFWTLDFNLTPMSSCYGQWKEYFGPRAYLTNEKLTEVEVLGEISLLKSSVPEAVEEFIDRLRQLHRGRPLPTVHLYGDPAGNAGNVAGPGLASWEIVKDHLTLAEISFIDHVPSAHPHIRDRVNAVNRACKNANGITAFWHAPTCRQLRKDFEDQGWKRDSNGNPTGKLDDTDKMRGHMGDALGYMLYDKFMITGRNGEQGGASPR